MLRELDKLLVPEGAAIITPDVCDYYPEARHDDLATEPENLYREMFGDTKLEPLLPGGCSSYESGASPDTPPMKWFDVRVEQLCS